MTDSCGVALVRCQHFPCRRTREAVDEDDSGAEWSCERHRYLDRDGPPDDDRPEDDGP